MIMNGKERNTEKISPKPPASEIPPVTNPMAAVLYPDAREKNKTKQTIKQIPETKKINSTLEIMYFGNKIKKVRFTMEPIVISCNRYKRIASYNKT